MFCFSRHLPATSWQPWGQKVSSSCTERAPSQLLNGYPARRMQRRQRTHCSWGQRAPPPGRRTLVADPWGDRGRISQERAFRGSEAACSESGVLRVQQEGAESPSRNEPGPGARVSSTSLALLLTSAPAAGPGGSLCDPAPLKEFCCNRARSFANPAF